MLEREEVWIRELELILVGIELVEHRNDRIIWEFDKFGWFSIRKLSSMLDELIEECESINWRLFWKIKVPYKVQCFLWMLVLERVPTKMFLVNRGLPIPTNQRACPWCGVEAEDINHVFLSCRWAYKFWCLFLQWWKVSWCLPRSCSQFIRYCFD